ncbi:hypothetical protein JCM8547_004279 [Rhodosporidiobolus lusitaniae]
MRYGHLYGRMELGTVRDATVGLQAGWTSELQSAPVLLVDDRYAVRMQAPGPPAALPYQPGGGLRVEATPAAYYEEYAQPQAYHTQLEQPYPSTSASPYPPSSSSFDPYNSHEIQQSYEAVPPASQYSSASYSASWHRPSPLQPHHSHASVLRERQDRPRQGSWVFIPGPDPEERMRPSARTPYPPSRQRRTSSHSRTRLLHEPHPSELRYDPYHSSVPAPRPALPRSYSSPSLPVERHQQQQQPLLHLQHPQHHPPRPRTYISPRPSQEDLRRVRAPQSPASLYEVQQGAYPPSPLRPTSSHTEQHYPHAGEQTCSQHIPQPLVHSYSDPLVYDNLPQPPPADPPHNNLQYPPHVATLRIPSESSSVPSWPEEYRRDQPTTASERPPLQSFPLTRRTPPSHPPPADFVPQQHGIELQQPSFSGAFQLDLLPLATSADIDPATYDTSAPLQPYEARDLTAVDDLAALYGYENDGALCLLPPSSAPPSSAPSLLPPFDLPPSGNVPFDLTPSGNLPSPDPPASSTITLPFLASSGPIATALESEDADKEARTLALAAIKRALYATEEPPLSYYPARSKQDGLNAIQGSFGARLKGKEKEKEKETRTAKMVETRTECWTCGNSMATLRLRGKDLTNLVPRPKGTCLACLPVDFPSPGRSSEVPSEPGYESTFSAAIDALENLDLGTAPPPPSVPGTPSNVVIPVGVLDDELGLPSELQAKALKCDVCSKISGVNSISAQTVDPSLPIPPFTVEVICSSCSTFYKPCSDCGGGGGRLTSGKWRCIELFPDGRKTCQLSHARFPALAEISFSTQLISTIPLEKMEEYIPVLKRLYFQTRLGVLARPECLSKHDGLASTFAEAEKTTIDSWNMLVQLLNERLDPLGSLQRYVTLMIAAPRGRRPGSTSSTKDKEATVIGFLLCEVDFAGRAAFYAAAVPWATSGVAFDANTLMGEHTTKSYKEDRQRLNIARAAVGLPPFPHVLCNWIVAPFKLASKMSQSLERRGYVHLKDYLRQHPEMDPQAFPPTREIWIPRKFTGAWHYFVRHLADEADLGGPPPKNVKKRLPPAKKSKKE